MVLILSAAPSAASKQRDRTETAAKEAFKRALGTHKPAFGTFLNMKSFTSTSTRQAFSCTAASSRFSSTFPWATSSTTRPERRA